jgi:hypothetical protein
MPVVQKYSQPRACRLSSLSSPAANELTDDPSSPVTRRIPQIAPRQRTSRGSEMRRVGRPNTPDWDEELAAVKARPLEKHERWEVVVRDMCPANGLHLKDFGVAKCWARDQPRATVATNQILLIRT